MQKKLIVMFSLFLAIQSSCTMKADIFDDVWDIVMPVVIVVGGLGAASYCMARWGNKETEPMKEEKYRRETMIPESSEIPPINKHSWS